ncbi:MAG: copper homeostasis protein CutC [Sphaerochaetaceae bacterium]
MTKYKIEVCLETVESVIRAEKGGADRVEFCSDLFEGGLTPTLGAFKIAKRICKIPMNVMIRPRGGDFCYSDVEFEVMKENAHIFKEEGANALVFGILTPKGEIDEERTAILKEIASPLPITFHRAIDMTRNAKESIEILKKLKVERVLTSGLESSVMEGILTLKKMIEWAGDDLIVMPGCGINERNFGFIKQELKAQEYHIFLQEEENSKMEYRPTDIYMGGLLRQAEFSIPRTSISRVKNIRSY